jgi:hypothetical protein
MNHQSDLEYYTSRAAVERALSDTAADPGIALIHTQLADRYELLAAREISSPRPLRVVTATEVAAAAANQQQTVGAPLSGLDLG